MLVREILAILGEAYRGETFLVEADVVAAAQVAVAAKYELGTEIGLGHIFLRRLADVARELPRCRVILAAGIAHEAQLTFARARRDTLAEYADNARILPSRLHAADNVVVEHAIQLP